MVWFSFLCFSFLFLIKCYFYPVVFFSTSSSLCCTYLSAYKLTAFYRYLLLLLLFFSLIFDCLNMVKIADAEIKSNIGIISIILFMFEFLSTPSIHARNKTNICFNMISRSLCNVCVSVYVAKRCALFSNFENKKIVYNKKEITLIYTQIWCEAVVIGIRFSPHNVQYWILLYYFLNGRFFDSAKMPIRMTTKQTTKFVRMNNNKKTVWTQTSSHRIRICIWL